MVAIILVAATVMGIARKESFVKAKASGKAMTENVGDLVDKKQLPKIGS